jgi:hypothetical protein
MRRSGHGGDAVRILTMDSRITICQHRDERETTERARSMDKFVTIGEAVELAMNNWLADGTSVIDMEALVDDFLWKAIGEWEVSEPSELPLRSTDTDAHTIQGAVLNAFADWYSAGTDLDEMKDLAEEYALDAVENWKSNHAASHQ